VVEAMQEHLGQVVHRLPLPLGQVTKLVQHKVGHSLEERNYYCNNILHGSFANLLK